LQRWSPFGNVDMQKEIQVLTGDKWPPLNLSKPKHGRITIATYNTLRRNYEFSFQKHVKEDHREWGLRLEMLHKQLKGFEADLLCLQECELGTIEEDFSKSLMAQGYGYVHADPKGGVDFTKPLIFFKRDKLRLRWHSPRSRLVIAEFEVIESGHIILVSSIHFTSGFDPSKRFGEARSLLKRLDTRRSETNPKDVFRNRSATASRSVSRGARFRKNRESRKEQKDKALMSIPSEKKKRVDMNPLSGERVKLTNMRQKQENEDQKVAEKKEDKNSTEEKEGKKAADEKSKESLKKEDDERERSTSRGRRNARTPKRSKSRNKDRSLSKKKDKNKGKNKPKSNVLLKTMDPITRKEELERETRGRKEQEKLRVPHAPLCIVCGDFNATQSDPVCILLRDGKFDNSKWDDTKYNRPRKCVYDSPNIKALVDAFEILDEKKSGRGYTYQGGIEGGPRGPDQWWIDYILYSTGPWTHEKEPEMPRLTLKAVRLPCTEDESKKCTKEGIPNAWHPSDHLPLAAVFDLPPLEKEEEKE